MGASTRHGGGRRGALAAAGTVVACGVLGAVGAAGAAQQAAEISASATTASEFVPDVQQIDTGDTIVWDFAAASPQRQGRHRARGGRRLDRRTHTTLKSSGEERRTFGRPGTYTYHCEVHPGTMTGTLEVVGRPGRDADAGADDDRDGDPAAAATPGPAPTTPVPGRPHHDAGARRAARADRTAPALSGSRSKGRAPAVRVPLPALGDGRR